MKGAWEDGFLGAVLILLEDNPGTGTKGHLRFRQPLECAVFHETSVRHFGGLLSKGPVKIRRPISAPSPRGSGMGSTPHSVPLLVCVVWSMIGIKRALPISELGSKRSPEERNVRKQLGKVRRYLAKSTDATFQGSWESRIAVYEAQLIKAEARARFIR
jgi:hypothetical protein